jgi:FkbM family methyltransferase
MIAAKLLVKLYFLVHGKLHLPGAGWLIRRMIRFVPSLTRYPLHVAGVGTAILDFRDEAAFGMLNVLLGDLGQDRQLIGRMEGLLRPGDVLWDVGANIGYLTMHFARRFPELSSIQAFEPNPAALKTLQGLFIEYPRVQVHPVGLGASDEVLELQALPNSTSWGTVTGKLQGGTRTKVPIRRGDDYRRQCGLALPNVMKIDVEGFEPNVLAGLRETISEARPAIVLEHIWLSDEQLRQLCPPGYAFYFIMEDGSLSQDFAQRMQGYNVIIIDPADSRASRLRES